MARGFESKSVESQQSEASYERKHVPRETAEDVERRQKRESLELSRARVSRELSGHPESLKMPPAPKLGEGPWVWAGAGTNTAYAGPWGVSYTANLTPDRLTGLGIWDEQMFIKTIRTGRHWGVSRPILPPMPWQNYRHMTDEDLGAVYAYLRSIKPIRNQVPEPIIAAPMVATK